MTSLSRGCSFPGQVKTWLIGQPLRALFPGEGLVTDSSQRLGTACLAGLLVQDTAPSVASSHVLSHYYNHSSWRTTDLASCFRSPSHYFYQRLSTHLAMQETVIL